MTCFTTVFDDDDDEYGALVQNDGQDHGACVFFGMFEQPEQTAPLEILI